MQASKSKDWIELWRFENLLVGERARIKMDYDVKSEEGRRALRLAINSRHVRVVHELLERGADPKSEHGYTPLEWACMPPVIDVLYISRVVLEDRESRHTHALFQDITDYSEFSQTDFEFIVRMLLDKGADIDAEFNGRTTLDLAAENERLTIFKTLLAAGANLARVTHHYPECLRSMLRQDEGCGAVYGEARLGRIFKHTKRQDIEFYGNCKARFESVVDLTYPLRLRALPMCRQNGVYRKSMNDGLQKKKKKN
ncbi:hypothetical protein V8C35DRAFT_256244 [Trichoderma chlorosporum]